MQSQDAHLDLNELEKDPDRFQFRHGLDERHVGVLRRALKSGSPLDPMLVWKSEEGTFVIDGHHRLEAYVREGWRKGIQVEFFKGSSEDAAREALRRNSKDKLPLTENEKRDAAWKLTATTELSVRLISKEAGVSVGTVQNMKNAAKALTKRGEDPAGYTRWHEARKASKGELGETTVTDDWMEQQAAEWSDRLSRTFGKKAQHQPEIFAMALEYYLGRRLQDVMEYLPEGPDDEDDEDGEF